MPTSTSARSTSLAASSAKAAAVSASNSVGGPSRSRDPVDGGQHPRDGPREARLVQRPPVDGDPLAVADQVWLRHGADPQPGGGQDGSGHGHHAALAVRAADQGAAQRALGMAELVEDGLDPLQPQADPESAARGQRRDGRGVVRQPCSSS